ncbi:DUF5305 family protein [Actinoplanes oblitus]|uniref:DUF5305 family protein n=1 Tax=Actinoplanes oblitus TaxID=3040509 RepID=A0ABY8WJX6_9ACTN|nr:DUF5305 family protein [Actinoplanes oblitus]WIM97160.1 DUF5305 family protein [Actinoplanes oblitus]
MQPLYHAGDLVFLTKVDSYEVGQIAAYHSASADVEVLHRIIGGDAESGFVFQGDNNDFIDPARPAAGELIGRAVLHVPRGGTWLRPLLSPTSLGMVGFLVIGGGAGAAENRRDVPRGRRKRKVKGMSRQGGSWAAAAAVVKAVSRLHPILRAAAALTALCGAAGLLLGVAGWMRPATQSAPISNQSGESMRFSYSAEVERSAAYDGTVAYSPDPIYRKLADFVDLQLQYRGKPGRLNVDARLSAQSGWHSTIQLSQPRRFTADRYTGTVLLDLDGMADRAREAARAIGADLGPITVLVIAHVLHDDGSTFAPQLALGLGPLQLSMVNGPDSLVVSHSGKAAGGATYPRQLSVLGHDLMTAAAARNHAIRLLLIALAGIIGIGLAASRSVPLATRAQIQRRYGHLLVPIEPMAKQSEPVVTVATFPALVKLAEKYGQMILTWTRPDGADDFVVRDDGVIYRFRIVPARPAGAKPPLSGMPHPARHARKSAALGIASVINTPAPPPVQTPEAPARETPFLETEPPQPPPGEPTSPPPAAQEPPTPEPATPEPPSRETAAQETPSQEIAGQEPAAQATPPEEAKLLEAPPEEAKPSETPSEEAKPAEAPPPEARDPAELEQSPAAEESPVAEAPPRTTQRKPKPARQTTTPRAAKTARKTAGPPATEPGVVAPAVPQEALTGPADDPAAGSGAAPEKAAPRKRAAPRKPRARKAAAPKTEIPKTEIPKTEAPKTEAEPSAAAADGESAAAERKAAEELADRNKVLEESIARKAEQDQAAADRARKERLARSAPRDPVFDFLPRDKQPRDD